MRVHTLHKYEPQTHACKLAPHSLVQLRQESIHPTTKGKYLNKHNTERKKNIPKRRVAEKRREKRKKKGVKSEAIRRGQTSEPN